VVIYRDQTKQDLLFKGPDVSKKTELFTVTPLPAGTYFFVCTYHPDQMFGTLIAG
jgi:plastocyanin